MNDFETLPELLDYIKETQKNPALLNYRMDNKWKAISAAGFEELTKDLALGLIKLGVKKDDKIGIIANSSPLWIMADLAISLAGGITVPVFNRISPENLQFEIDDAGIDLMFIGDIKEYDQVRLYGKRVKKIITIGYKKEDESAVVFEDVIGSGRNYRNVYTGNIENMFHRSSEDDIFSIIYTSGSTGAPKGVMLSHRNIISQVKAAAIAFNVTMRNDRAISSLPLAHIFERMVMYFYLSRGVSVYFVDDLNNIGALIREVKPTIMTAVPRLLEKIHDKMYQAVEESTGYKRKLALAAFARAETKDAAGGHVNLMDIIYNILVYSKLKEALGGHLRYVISGAASLSADIGRFFENIGIPLFEGYGLTEASPVIAANRMGMNKLGTVGKAFPSVSLSVAEDGEILAKGPNVMLGYYHRPAETAVTLLPDGSLRTGDLGRLDSEGYLKIIGRKKELFKKSTGEDVPPIPIEQALEKLDIVDTAVVIAEGRKFVGCLIFPDFEAAALLKKREGFVNLNINEFLDSEFIHNRIKKHIAEMNSHLHHTEEVQKYTLIKAPISVETGELTPTLKIRRSIIEEKFKKEIDALYAS